MRLIDADVFKTEYENLITWVSHRAEKARLREFIKDIQDQPTIKAIPIEWIEQYIWSADTHDEKRALRKMCIQWEEENGKSGSSD